MEEVGESEGMGTWFLLDGKRFPLNRNPVSDHPGGLECYTHTYSPLFQLYIFGAEHDAVELCKAAKLLGWEVTIVAPPDEEKSIAYFPGAARLITPAYDRIDVSEIDSSTAVMLMSHSFHKDVQYLIALQHIRPAYFGMLGPSHRREQILSKFLEYCPEAAPEFLELLRGPAGLSIGAENAPEIAISILAEILSVVREQEPMALRRKTGSIHG